jgi:hypothetical protein
MSDVVRFRGLCDIHPAGLVKELIVLFTALRLFEVVAGKWSLV